MQVDSPKIEVGKVWWIVLQVLSKPFKASAFSIWHSRQPVDEPIRRWVFLRMQFFPKCMIDLKPVEWFDGKGLVFSAVFNRSFFDDRSCDVKARQR